MVGIPNGMALKTLPLRALVAFAARSAERVEPYFYLPMGHPRIASAEEAVRNAIQVSLDFVNGSEEDPQFIQMAEDWVVKALLAVSEGESPDTQAALACNAAYAAINAAVVAVNSVKAPSRANEGSKVVAAAVAAAEAAMVVDPEIRHHIGRDYQFLTKLNLGRFPDWGRPFDAGDKSKMGPIVLTKEAEIAQKQGQRLKELYAMHLKSKQPALAK
jgi:hypothetical protein